MALPSKVFRGRVKEARKARGWTQRDLAAALEKVDVKIDASNITRLESGSRTVTLDEVIAIAVVLGVSPLHLIVPLDDNGAQLTPALTVTTQEARAWLRGQTPLKESDERWFYTQTPESEADWFPFVPGSWRSIDQEDLRAARPKWEREIFRAVIGGRSLEPGPDAEDIPVRRPQAPGMESGGAESHDDHGT